MYKRTKEAINKQADSIVPDKWDEISRTVSENAKLQAVSESRKNYSVKRIVGLVACFCLVLGTILFYQGGKKPPVSSNTDNTAVLNTTQSSDNKSDTNENRTVITDSTNKSGRLDMRAPYPGEKLYSMRLHNALKEHKGEDVYYLLSFSCMLHTRDGSQSRPATEEEKAAEYQRLVALGYELYTAEAWTYDGDEGKKAYYPIVVGCYTEEDLLNFKVNPKYGYMFDFVNNGDGSALSFDECEKNLIKKGSWRVPEKAESKAVK